MSHYKKAVLIIASIFTVVVTLFFLVVRITPLFVAAYIVVILGIGTVLCGNFYLIAKVNDYPWIAAIPITTIAYLSASFALAFVIVLLEQFHVFSMPIKWFVLAEVIVLACFATRVIVLNSGRIQIERVDAQSCEKHKEFEKEKQTYWK